MGSCNTRIQGVPLVLSVTAAITLIGCATVPSGGVGQHPQIRRGRPAPFLDGLGYVIGMPSKLILGSEKIDNHDISGRTESVLAAYLATAPTRAALQETAFRLNEYAPADDLRRLIRNRHVAWPYRLLLGLPVTLVFDVLLPGRIFGGDNFNPFTNTVHLYSDHPAVALHEAGHAQDFAQRRFKGSYALLRFIPGVDLFQEFIATEHAVEHLVETQNIPAELEAYTVLYPAFGTYVGSYYTRIVPLSQWAGACAGHVWGQAKASARSKYYSRLKASEQTAPPPHALPPAIAAPAVR